jgi:hypothetical protein
MRKMTTLNTLSHSVYNLNYHLVLVTKYRRKVITKAMLADLENVLSRICLSWHCEMMDFNGETDHVHLLISAHPNLKLSDCGFPEQPQDSLIPAHPQTPQRTCSEVLLEARILASLLLYYLRRRCSPFYT